MSRADIEAAFASEKASEDSRKCKVGRQIAATSPEEQSVIEEKIADHTLSTDKLVRILGRVGVVTVTPNTMATHRRGLCSCGHAA